MLTMFGVAVAAAAIGAIAVTVLSAIAKVDEVQFLLGETIWWFFGMTLVSIIATPFIGGAIFAGFRAARITHVLAYVGAGAVGGTTTDAGTPGVAVCTTRGLEQLVVLVAAL